MQHDVVLRISGFLSLVGAFAALVLMAFFPPTAAIGSLGWLVILPTVVLSVTCGVLSLKFARRPRWAAIYTASFTGLVQIALMEWLAGGGRAPYVQLLLVPVVGAGVGQTVGGCGRVLVAASLVALSPLLYSSIDVASTVTEFALLSVMSMTTAIVIASTREHRARLKDAGEQANTLAHVDPLTGMLNRRAFDEELVRAIERMRLDGSPLSLMLCDVNAFKEINDTFGHAAGDEVLRSIARTMSNAVRKPDVAFRWAGDEFAVILSDTDDAGATRAAQRLREAVARECERPDGREITIGTGVAQLAPGMGTDDAVREADGALYRHKAQRRSLRSAA